MRNRIVIAGMLTVVLAMFAISSAVALPIPDGKQAIVWFAPNQSSATPGEEITVQLRVNTSVQLGGWADWPNFDPNYVNITKADYTGSSFPTDTDWSNWGNYVKVLGMDEALCELTTGELLLVTLTLKGINPGTSQLYHDPDHVEIFNCDGYDLGANAVWVNGTFTCIAPPETFTKELVTGWNLISLPLTNATNMTVANIMSSVSGKYDALYSYNATTKGWVSLDSLDTMANGVGYFIHMSSAGTWSYTGVAYTAMNVSLQPGLNMFGWLNCSKSISESVASNCNYVARWNATSQAFETCNPVAPPEFKDFSTLDRGEGYFISAKAAGMLNETCSD